MTPAERFGLLLHRVQRPGRYLGTEVNAVLKDRAAVDLLFCLAFPDVYEVGMSHPGLQILYHVLNSRPRIACERVFAPWPDLETLLYRHDIPLLTLESRTPVNQTDILGFSLEYELSYATVLRMLAAARIPLLSRDRDTSVPLVIAGGPCTYNPEPVADFFDAVVIGDGEEVIVEIADTFRAWRAARGTRQELLDALAALPGVYVPSLFAVTYHPSGAVAAITPKRAGRERVLSRVVHDLDAVPYCTAPIVPYLQTVHDRAQIEIARGCTRGCRFCMAGMIYRPVRERSFERIGALTDAILTATGYEELSPVSLSAGDHTCIQAIVGRMTAAQCRDRIAVSLPSLRVATLTADMIRRIRSVRKTGFTIAPEAGSARLRTVINKGITEQEIIATADQVFDAGWKLLKLYFMIGLPTETAADIDAIIALCREIAARHRGRQLNVSVSSFVPKPHTPFQWEAQEHPDAIHEKQRLLKRALHRGSVHLKYHDRLVSVLEGVFSRGDRRLADVLRAAHRRGAGFEAWTEHFKYSLWMDAFAECGIDPLQYLRRRDVDEPLPWAHISCGADPSFLLRERARALRGELTPDCRQGDCAGCGVCTAHATTPRIAAVAPVEAPPAASPDPGAHVPVWMRLRYAKTGRARLLSHLELSRALARAMRRARLPLSYSQGFHPLPRIVFHHALPVGVEGLGEVCDVKLVHPLPPDDIAAALRPQMPPGISLVAVGLSIGSRPPAPSRVHAYRVLPANGSAASWPAPDALRSACAGFEQSADWPATFVRNGSAYGVNLKSIIARLALPEPLTIEMDVRTSDQKTPKVAEIIDRIFSIENHTARIIKLPALTPEPPQDAPRSRV